MSLKSKSGIASDITNIKTLNVSDGKIDATELSLILNDINDSKGHAVSATHATSVGFIEPLTVINLSLTGNVTFTVNTTGAVAGSQTIERITANGSNTISFSSPFKKSVTSSDFITTNGVINVVYFWFDGTDYWYTIDQAQ